LCRAKYFVHEYGKIKQNSVATDSMSSKNLSNFTAKLWWGSKQKLPNYLIHFAWHGENLTKFSNYLAKFSSQISKSILAFEGIN